MLKTMALESAVKALMLLSPGWLGQHLVGNKTLVIRLTDAHCCNMAHNWTVTIKFNMHAPMHHRLMTKKFVA